MSDIFPLMNLLRRLADNTRPDSLASKLRRKRFQLFKKLISPTDKKPLTILDVGGTLDFWKTTHFLAEYAEVQLTLLNIFKMKTHLPRVTSVVGDGRDMKQFRDRQFDLVFSNSVIEHVGDFADQKRMAHEIRRVGSGYFVQTPNLYFPIEPHFLFPFFQFLPLSLRTLLLRHFKIGWHGPAKNAQKARKTAASVRLLRKAELARLFPDARICDEKLFGFTKSFIVMRPPSPHSQTDTPQPPQRHRSSLKRHLPSSEKSSATLHRRRRRPAPCV